MAFENSEPTESAHQKYNSQVVSPAHRPQPHVCRLRTEWRAISARKQPPPPQQVGDP